MSFEAWDRSPVPVPLSLRLLWVVAAVPGLSLCGKSLENLRKILGKLFRQNGHEWVLFKTQRDG
jgi:hypothetical protein